MSTELVHRSSGFSSSPSWTHPNVDMTGAIVLERGESPLVTFEPQVVRGWQVGAPNSKWSLSEQSPPIDAPLHPSALSVSITSDRVTWHKRIADGQYGYGHMRFEWAQRVESATTDDGRATLVLKTFEEVEGQKVGSYLQIALGSDESLAEAAADWVLALVAAYRLDRFRKLGVPSDEIDSILKNFVADPPPGGVPALGGATVGCELALHPDGDRAVQRRARVESTDEALCVEARTTPPAPAGLMERLAQVTAPGDRLPPPVYSPLTSFRRPFVVSTALASGEDRGELFPQVNLAEALQPVVLEADEILITTQVVSSVSILDDGEELLRIPQLATLVLTDRRSAFVVTRVEQLLRRANGEFLSGPGIRGVVGSLRGRAKGEPERCIAGHIRHEWLSEVSASAATDRVELAMTSEHQERDRKLRLVLQCARRYDVLGLATSVAQKAAKARLASGVESSALEVLGRCAGPPPGKAEVRYELAAAVTAPPLPDASSQDSPAGEFTS